MKAKIKYLEPHPRSGVLRFRRPYPPHLRPYIPGSTQLMRSIGARKITEFGAMDQYNAALADYERIVGVAKKQASGTFDTLPEPEVVFLAAVFARDQAEWIEKGRLRPDAEKFAEDALHGIWWMEDEYLRWRVENDVEAMVEHWSRQARGLLDERGITLDPQDSVSFARLCRALNDTAIAIQNDQRARLSGKVLPVPDEPEEPARGRKAASAIIDRRSFEDIAEDILEHSVPPVGVSTREATRTALRFFREATGLLAPAEITRAAVTSWIRLLAQRPSKVPASERTVPLADLAARYANRPEVPRLAQKTLAQHVRQLSAIWVKARKDGVEAIPLDLPNPFADRAFEIPAPPEEPQELSLAELHAVFALPIFTNHALPKRGRGWASYWMPLIMLFTGARPEEVAQLMVGDFTQDRDGRWQLRITDEGTHPVKGKRSLKTGKKQTGRRTFLVPQPLLALGIVQYVDHLRTTGDTALFPLLTIKGKRGHLFSVWGGWWSDYLQNEKRILPSGEGRRASRELRHNFPSAARASGVPEECLEYIMGHGRAKTSRRYGGRKALGDWIEDVRFEGLDLSGVKPWVGS